MLAEVIYGHLHTPSRLQPANQPIDAYESIGFNKSIGWSLGIAILIQEHRVVLHMGGWTQ